jgi:hypothetical protein
MSEKARPLGDQKIMQTLRAKMNEVPIAKIRSEIFSDSQFAAIGSSFVSTGDHLQRRQHYGLD